MDGLRTMRVDTHQRQCTGRPNCGGGILQAWQQILDDPCGRCLQHADVLNTFFANDFVRVFKPFH